MKRFTAVVLVLVIALTLVVPTVLGLTWTQRASRTATNMNNLASFSFEPDIGVFIELDRMTRCVGTSCSITTLRAETSTNAEIHTYGDTNAMYCYEGSTTSYELIKTTNKAASWSQPIVIASGLTTNSNACAIDSVDADNFAVAIFRGGATNNELHFTTSTDGGAAWAASSVIATDAHASLDQDVDVVIKDSSNFLVVYPTSGSVLRACRTTNGGASFTCVTVASPGVRPTLEWDSFGNQYILSFDVNGGGRVATSSDGAFWSISSSGLGSLFVHAMRVGTNQWIASSNNGGGTDTIRFHTSTDGITWTNEAVLSFASCAGLLHDSAVAYTNGNGLVYVGSIDSDNGCGGGDTFRAFTAVLNAPPPPSAANFTATVTAGRGFAVDDNGQTVIVRHRPGAAGTNEIKTYSGTNLAAKGTLANDCDRFNGVMSIGTHVGFLDCDGSDAVDEFLIRSDALGTPSLNANCDEQAGGLPTQVINQGDGAAIADVLNQIKETSEFPISYINTNEGPEVCVFSFGFSTENPNNKIGVLMYSARGSGQTDQVLVASTPFGGQVDEICTFRDSAGESYIGGAGPTTTTKVFRIDFSLDASGNLNAVLAGPLFTGSGVLGNAVGLACNSDDHMAILTTDSVRIVNWRTGFQVASKTGLTTSGKMVGLSDLVQLGIGSTETAMFAAYRNSANYEIANASDASMPVVLTVAKLAGTTDVDMDLHSFAQTLYAMTDTTVGIYNVFFATTTDPFGDTSPPLPTPSPTPTPSAGLLNDIRNNIATGGLVSFEASGWLLSLTLVAGLMLAARRAGFVGMVPMGVIALLAIGIAVTLGLLPVWFLLVIIFLIIGLAGSTMFRSDGGAE